MAKRTTSTKATPKATTAKATAQPPVEKETKAAAPAAKAKRVRCDLDPMDRSMLETRCNEVSKRNAELKRSQFFIGATADAKGSGHALIEGKPGGAMVTHWGTLEELEAILDNA